MTDIPPTKGLGCIEISNVLPFHDISLTDHATWHTRLLLPDSYEIERVEHFNPMICGYKEGWGVFVRHDLIPADSDHIYVTPKYGCSYADGVQTSIYLVSIEISVWNGDRWELVAVTDKREEAITHE